MNDTRVVPVELPKVLAWRAPGDPWHDGEPSANDMMFAWGHGIEIEYAYAAPPPPSTQADALLPCDVRVAPATTISAGVSVSTLLSCIELRRGSGEQHRFTRTIEQRDADARDAARYRFLRNPGNAIVYAKDKNAWGGYAHQAAGHVRYDTPEMLDAAIDRAQESGNGR